MRCALVLFNNAAFEGIFRIQVFGSAGIDRCAISCFASKPGRNLQTQIRRRRWSADVGNRVGDFQAWRFVPGVICRPSGCDLLVVQLAGDKPLL